MENYKTLFSKKFENRSFFYKKESKVTKIIMGKIVKIGNLEKFDSNKRDIRFLKIWTYGDQNLFDFYIVASSYISKKALTTINEDSFIYLEANLLPDSYFGSIPFYEIENIVIE